MKKIIFSVCDDKYINQTIVSINSFFEVNDTKDIDYYLFVYTKNVEVIKDVVERFCASEINLKVIQVSESEKYARPNICCISQDNINVVLCRLRCLEMLYNGDSVSYTSIDKGNAVIASGELYTDANTFIHLDLDTLHILPLDIKGLECDGNTLISGVDERQGNVTYLTWSHKKKELPRIYINCGCFGISRELCDGIVEKFKAYFNDSNNETVCLEQDYLNYIVEDERKKCIHYNNNVMSNNIRYYKRVKPRMIHYLGSAKPFGVSKATYDTKYEKIYFNEYLGAVMRYRGLLDNSFIEKVKEVVMKCLNS